MKSHELHAGLLSKYASKQPKQFLQLDAFYLPDGDDSFMSPDKDGDCLMELQVYELMRGPDTARVLIPATSTPERAARALRKIAEWLEEDGEQLFEIGHRTHADVPTWPAVLKFNDLPF